jgi:hypothetical protein
VLSDRLLKFRSLPKSAQSFSPEKRKNKVLNLIKQLHRDYSLYLINTIYLKLSGKNNGGKKVPVLLAVDVVALHRTEQVPD